MPGVIWTKAVHAPTGEIMGVANWALPGAPIHNHLLRSAVEHYGFKEKMQWSDEQVDEMWSHITGENGDDEKDDVRREVMQGEDHWWLAMLMVLPQWQGRGVGKLLLNWAIEQADAKVPPVPMYLETSKMARAVYLRFGFVPIGEVNMVRRGPGVESGKEKAVGAKAE
jgi:GNAT superfamily N-acetyltransferase